MTIVWNNLIANNITGLPAQLSEYENLIKPHGLYDTLGISYEESALVPFYKPRIYLSGFNTNLNDYASVLLLPLILNGVKLSITSTEYTEQILEDADAGINVYYSGGEDAYGTYNEGLSKILNANVSVDGYNIYIRTHDYSDLSKIIHKAIACLYNLLTMNGVTFNVYPFDSELYNDLFNYKIDSFLVRLDNWIATFYYDASSNYESRLYNNAIKTLVRNSANTYKKELDIIKGDIARYEKDLERMYSRLRHQQYLYNGAMYNASDEMINELTTIFKRCDNLKSVRAEQSKIYLRFVSPLLSYDLDLAKQWCENDGNPFAEQYVQGLMYNLLVSDKYTLMLEAEVVWNLDDLTVRSNNDISITDNCPQPHLYYYNCFGDNKTMIQQALGTQEFSLALDCTNAAMSAVNIIDSPVLTKLIDWVTSSNNVNKPCVLNNYTGECVSIKEVFEDDSIVRATA